MLQIGSLAPRSAGSGGDAARSVAEEARRTDVFVVTRLKELSQATLDAVWFLDKFDEFYRHVRLADRKFRPEVRRRQESMRHDEAQVRSSIASGSASDAVIGGRDESTTLARIKNQARAATEDGARRWAPSGRRV